MPRLFCDTPLAVNQEIKLPKALTRHLMVLRLVIGENITLFNGHGGEYTGILINISKNDAIVKITHYSPIERELPYNITLAQGLPEANKMDWIVEKTTELGVNTILPIAAERSVTRLDNDRAIKRIERWQAITIAAAQQCGRNHLPHILPPLPFSKIIEHTPSPCLLLSPRATQTLPSWAKQHPPQDITLLIGPEGGFSPKEEQSALNSGATLLSIGSRILRTETAGIAIIAMLNALWELS